MPTVSPRHVDNRAVRFAAAVGAGVMALGLFLGPTLGLPLVAVQTLVFAIGAIMGLPAQPFMASFRTWVRPRLKGRTTFSPEPPIRFAESLGMLLGVSAMIAGTLSAQWWFYVVAGVMFAGLFLQATIGFCLGCSLYEKVAAGVGALPADQPAREDSNA